jgi:hypothetical protein
VPGYALAVEFVALGLAGAAVIAAIVVRHRRGRHVRLAGWSAFVVADAALLYASLAPPIGPLPILTLLLILLSVVILFEGIAALTGFRVRSRRSLGPGAGRYRSTRQDDGYSGLRGD